MFYVQVVGRKSPFLRLFLFLSLAYREQRHSLLAQWATIALVSSCDCIKYSEQSAIVIDIEFFFFRRLSPLLVSLVMPDWKDKYAVEQRKNEMKYGGKKNYNEKRKMY